MTGASATERETALRRLGELARSELSGEVSREEELVSRGRFRESLAKESGRSVVLWLGAAAATAAVAAGVVLAWRAPTAPLTFEIDAPEVARNDYFLVPSTSPSAHVRFSDGSDLTLAPGAQGRISALHAHGGVVGLESGKASLHVVHRPDTRWSVDAGPFAVTVTGTAFDVGWSGASELFELTLRSGSVTVKGPLAGSGIQLDAGHRLVANLKTSQLQIEPLGATAHAPAHEPAEPDPNEATGSPASDTSPPRSEPPASARSAAGTGDARPSWAKRVAAGDFDGVLAEVQQSGLEGALVQGSLADLVALADAARYRGRTDIARKALLAQRERFPASTAARTAAFLLGRLGESDGEGDIAWYDRYLREAPNGEFASEALGRKLVAVQRISGPNAARPVAKEYLRRFPRGSYAAKARELVVQ
jgi:ferric-dicitrate binding protein FerR (iron transport regulator)